MLNFIEIEEFFKRESFTEEELIELRTCIKNKYHSNYTILKQAYSSIDLHILRYRLLPAPNEIKKVTVKNIGLKPTKGKVLDTDKMSLSEKLLYYREKDIYFILNEITDADDKENFLKLLKSHGFYKGKLNVVLTSEQYSLIYEDLKILFICNKPRDPFKKIKTNKKTLNNRSLSQSQSVFDKAKMLGGVGKLIYIRTK